MKSDRKSNRKTWIERSLSLHSRPSEEEVRSAVDRTWQEVQSVAQTIPFQVEALEDSHPRRYFSRAWLTAWAAAAILVVVSIVVSRSLIPLPGALATVESAGLEGLGAGQAITFNQLLRSKGPSTASVALNDGSRIEIKPGSELLLERAEDGIRIHLNRGSVTVHAAKQSNGHLYVQTRDVGVSVVGTIFTVHAQQTGSRVSVIEGEVQVRLGSTSTRLREGQQVETTAYLSPETGELVGPPSRQAASVKFEVTSVKQSLFPNDYYFAGYTSDGICNKRNLFPKGNRLVLEKMSLCGLIATAYDLRSYQIVGLPSSMMKREPSIYYDIEAKAETELTSGTAVEMLRTFLADRFQLKFRRETRVLPVYALVVAKNGPKLNLPASGVCSGRSGPGFVVGTGLFAGCAPETSMAELSRMLSLDTDRPVVDKTGLTGNYAFELRWSPQINPATGEATVPNDSLPTLFTAVQEQLGLRLEAQTAEAPVLVIERAESPTPN